MESHKRSIAKTVTWRVVGTLITFSVAYLLTGNLVLSIGIGGLDTTIKLFAYFFHERGWNKIKWERK